MSLQSHSRIRPHYLLQLSPVELLAEDGQPLVGCPDWVSQSLKNAPYVVVRRGVITDSLIPVGVRGVTRKQRFAAFVHAKNIANCVSPGDLLGDKYAASRAQDTKYGALSSLRALEQLWSAIDLPWGPGGSTGFELATNIPTVTEASDLDIVIYADRPVAILELRGLAEKLSTLGAAVDVQIETEFCGFSLTEYCREYPKPILLKTIEGAVLGVDPWSKTSHLAQVLKV